MSCSAELSYPSQSLQPNLAFRHHRAPAALPLPPHDQAHENPPHHHQNPANPLRRHPHQHPHSHLHARATGHHGACTISLLAGALTETRGLREPVPREARCFKNTGKLVAHCATTLRLALSTDPAAEALERRLGLSPEWCSRAPLAVRQSAPEIFFLKQILFSLHFVPVSVPVSVPGKHQQQHGAQNVEKRMRDTDTDGSESKTFNFVV